jgi:hypothetical protein
MSGLGVCGPVLGSTPAGKPRCEQTYQTIPMPFTRVTLQPWDVGLCERKLEFIFLNGSIRTG